LAKLNTLVGTSLFPSLLLLLSWDAPATTDNTDRVLPGAPRPLPLMANADPARAAEHISKCPNFIALLLLILKNGPLIQLQRLRSTQTFEKWVC
jgi:hypothetical protein